MRQILSLIIISVLLSSLVSPIGAITITPSESDISRNTPIITYPAGDDFIRLKSLINENFISKKGYQYNCIMNGTMCPTYRYTSVIEKAIKMIVIKTYMGNEIFYLNLFANENITSKEELDSLLQQIKNNQGDIKANISLQSIINRVPKGSSLTPWQTGLGFGRSISGDLLDASFGVNFAENANSSTMLGAIEAKIKEMRRDTCQKENPGDNYILCPWNGEISNQYLPTQKELYTESIYLNRGSVQIESLKDEMEYNVEKSVEIQNMTNDSGELISRYVSVPSTYILRYKKNSYTLEEAKSELDKKNTSNEEFLVTSNNTQGSIQCQQYTGYLVRSQCIAALAGLKEVQTALAAYNIDTITHPADIGQLSPSYLPKFPPAFTENFSYKATTNTQGQPDYEIRYIGHIGEGNTGTGEVDGKKDYKAMMSGATVPEIPQIFAHVPSDSMVLYVRNPANLIDILNQKSNTSQRLSGIDVSESIRGFMKTFFELEKFDQIEKNLKHDMAIVVNNLDATAPDIVIILSESDREALAPTAKARVVGSKDGFIFIASSKESLEKLTNLTVEKSLKNAPDFHYVWWKKSTLVKDALMFVGDEFFAKMLTLETYLTHYRKYRDYRRLSSIQELVWAYGEAFDKSPTGFDELTGLGLSTLTGSVLSEYSISDGLVTHNNIGSLKFIKTIPEARYDLSKISRAEIEDYKYNVLQYREIWRSSLDPMGIVLNRYGDGMEIDFFMTPIPSSPDRDLVEMQKIFEGTTKNSLSFVTNPQIRMGLMSFVLGFDPQKLQTKIKSSEDIGRGFEEFSKELLDGKNIFDYLGGEFAGSIGSLDPDIFEGWNVEKIDAYISVQVATEAKGKELIEMLKKKFLGEMNRGSSSVENSMFSMLAKPLIEDYQGKKIYYFEAIPVPWVGKIGLAYTFVDDFFIIGLNRSTIRHIIDTAASGDPHKKNLVNVDTFEKGTFFATLLDGVSFSAELKELYLKNQSTIPRFFGSMVQSESTITPLISSYYATEDRSRRLGKKPVLFLYELGSLSLSGSGDTMIVKMDPNKLKRLSGATLEMWQSSQKDPIFPAAILTEQGIPLEVFLAYPEVGDIVSINMIVQLDSALGRSDSLLRNITFGMNMGDDEIGFRLRIFRDGDGTRGSSGMGGFSDIWMIALVMGGLSLLGGIVYVVMRRRRMLPPENLSVYVATSPSTGIPVSPQIIAPSPISAPVPIPASANINISDILP